MHRFHLFGSVLLASVTSLEPICAQAHTRTVPRVFTGWYSGTAHTATLGRTKFFIQTWHHGSNLAIPSPILQIGYRAHRGIVAPAQQQTLEVVLTSTTTTYASLSKTFQANLGTDATIFFSLKAVNLPAQNSPTDPDVPAAWIVGDRPYVFVGPHLLVQVDVQTSATPTSTPYRTDGYEMIQSTQHGVSETGCSGSLVAGYATGTWSLRVTGALPNGPVLFMLGRENTLLGGSVQLPLDLSPLGMNGCVLGVDPLLIVAAAADPSGNASLTIPFVLGAESTVIHAQAATGTRSNPVGLGTTNAAHSILGKDGLSAYVFNWATFTPTAEFGPFARNTAEVLLLRP